MTMGRAGTPQRLSLGKTMSETTKRALERMAHHRGLDEAEGDLLNMKMMGQAGYMNAGGHHIPQEWFRSVQDIIGGKWDVNNLIRGYQDGTLDPKTQGYIDEIADPRFRDAIQTGNISEARAYQQEILTNPQKYPIFKPDHTCFDCKGGHNTLYYHPSKERQIETGSPTVGKYYSGGPGPRRRIQVGIEADKDGKLIPKIEHVQRTPSLSIDDVGFTANDTIIS